MRPGRPQLTNPLSYRSILGSKLGEVWHCGAGIALSGTDVTSWTGLVRGIQLVPSGPSTRPTYGADSTYFKGRNVVQSTRSTLTGLAASFTPIGGSSDLGCVLFVGRTRTDPAGTDFDMMASIINTNGLEPLFHSNSLDLMIVQNGQTSWGGLSGGFGGIVAHGFVYEDASHFVNGYGTPESGAGIVNQKTWELGFYTDGLGVGTGHDNFENYVDGTLAAATYDISTVSTRLGPVDTVKFGTSGARGSDASCAFLAYLFSPPTTTERALLMSMFAAEFG